MRRDTLVGLVFLRGQGGVREEPVLLPGDGSEPDARGTVDLGEGVAAVLALKSDRVCPQGLQIAHAAHEIMRPGPFEGRFPDRRAHETRLVYEGDVFVVLFPDPVRHDQDASAFDLFERPVERAEREIPAGFHAVELEVGCVGRDHGVRDAVIGEHDGRSGRQGLREVLAHVLRAGEGIPEILHGERDARWDREADVDGEEFREAAFQGRWLRTVQQSEESAGGGGFLFGGILQHDPAAENEREEDQVRTLRQEIEEVHREGDHPQE